MSEMIERVARAIYEAQKQGVYAEMGLARAAIRAMREPDYEMARAGAVRAAATGGAPGHIWHAMIDAALTPVANDA